MVSVDKLNRFGPPIGLLVIAGALLGLMPYAAGYDTDRRALFDAIYIISRDVEDWSHTIFVPALVGLLILWKRRDLPLGLREPFRWGWLVLGLGCFFFWFGYVADVVYIGYLSWQVILAGLVLVIFGFQFFRGLFFLWFFLVFTWPFLFLDTMLAFPLRQLMSMISYQFLNLVGVDTELVGTAIVSAANSAEGLSQSELFAVDIADPCSGIRSLFALAMMSALYGYVIFPVKETFSRLQKEKPWMKGVCLITDYWKHWLLIASALPLAVVGNFFRVMMLTFGTMWFGDDFAIGTHEDPSAYHLGAGFAVFVVALMGMVVVSSILEEGPVEYFRRRFGRIKKIDPESKHDEEKGEKD
ncbi:MAG: exosortase/archaeosortase family protein [Verrucomicrobiota bacterium]